MRCDLCDNRVCIDGTERRGPDKDIALPEGDAALLTTLAVKDRVLAHNPPAAINYQYVRPRFY